MTTTALVLVDIQNDYFPGGLWPVPNMETAARNATRLLARARETGAPVFHIRHEMARADAPFFRAGSEGSAVHASVAPTASEPVIVKGRPNAFAGTDLRTRLQAAQTRRVVICGAMSQMCVDATARAAADLGFEVIVAEDACGAKEATFGAINLTAAQVHAAFMAPLAMSYGRVLPTAEALGHL